jgi:hypothetical protein
VYLSEYGFRGLEKIGGGKDDERDLGKKVR